MAMNPKEIAYLRVNGTDYYDWTSVTVEVRITQAFPIFQFDCTEFDEVTKLPTGMSQAQIANNMRIVPGDIVEVYLAGIQIILGYVTERHVGYDARSHGVRIVGVGKTYDLVSTSVWQQGGAMDNQNWAQIAQKLIAPYGIGLQTKGSLDLKPYEQVHVQPGEIVWSALERYARQRAIVMGSTHDGKLLGIGPHAATESDQLVEGLNILRANAVIADDNVYHRIFAVGQRAGNDNVWGDQASKLVGQVSGSAQRYRPLVTVMDVSDDQHGAQQRAQMDKIFTEGGRIEANITVQGWLRESGDLWRAGDYYWVRSPMLLMNMKLGCRSIVYEQSDNAGTTTTLTLVDPIHMQGIPGMGGPPPTEAQ
jgi:prophage tail gpP-like protein